MNSLSDTGISAGVMAVIIIAAIAVLVGLTTLLCTGINFAKSRRRTRRLQVNSSLHQFSTVFKYTAGHEHLCMLTNFFKFS